MYLLRYQVPNKSILILSFHIFYRVSFVISSQSPYSSFSGTLYLKYFKDCVLISWAQQQLYRFSHLKNMTYSGNIFCWHNTGILVPIVTKHLHFLQSCLSRLRYSWYTFINQGRNGKNKAFFPLLMANGESDSHGAQAVRLHAAAQFLSNLRLAITEW